MLEGVCSNNLHLAILNFQKKWGGRVLLVVGIASDVWSIVKSSKPLRQTAKVVAGWAGAWAGCEVAGAAGAAAGSFEPGGGTAVGGFLGCLGGGIGSYFLGSKAGGIGFDWRGVRSLMHRAHP